jgi:phosphatidylethanolamine/phosphatidyl-N-methylethanolamine N-methyltransferase
MALFDRDTTDFRADARSQALSVIAIENDFVEGTYKNIAGIYDVMFGPILHPGRLRAVRRMNIQRGNRVLEVGVGTGINCDLYPRHCEVTGIDLSPSMLERARQRVSRKGLRNIRLMEMDAAHLKFADNSFDIVYAPYLVNCVSDPLSVVNEMKRVCKPGGKIVIVNHFRSSNKMLSMFDKAISPLTVHIGFKADLDLPGFLKQTGLKTTSIEKVSGYFWSLVICRND